MQSVELHCRMWTESRVHHPQSSCSSQKLNGAASKSHTTAQVAAPIAASSSSWIYRNPPMTQPVASSASGGADPVAGLTDGAKQLAINQQGDAGATKGQKQPKAQQAKKDKKQKDGASSSSRPVEMNPLPEYFAHRSALFDKLKAEQDAERASKPRTEITITMPDGSTRQGTAWETSPLDVAKEISKSLSERIVIAKVDDGLWDLPRPLEQSCKLEFFDFESPEGKRVFWHSSAHVLGEAAERHYGCHLCIGPPTEDGFFYEMGMGLSEGSSIVPEDFAPLETIVNSAIKEKQTFDRLVVSKADLLEMFKYNKYKQHIISSKIPDGTSTTVYRCGPMIDLCVGPHIPNTGRIKAMSVLKASASYFLGNQANDSLQRLYGISFPDKKQMTEYKQFLLEAAKRDHRRIGKDQELFLFNEMSPGSCFWLPHGTRIYNTLTEYMRSEYRKRGFEEVISPNMYNSKLWQTSGHWANYKDDMFVLPVEDKEVFALKPMNCPGHCLMFGARDRSYRELPLRFAEFGVIHRNEASGALSGLTRVRRFVQDDAHIFCMVNQIEDEVTSAFEFLNSVYGKFGFTFKLELSTRPEKYLGEIETWNLAESKLEAALNKFVPGKWELNPGDGAFYGPKIDITISDAMKRQFQCATIQLDFQLPQRFGLQFRKPNSSAQPVSAVETTPAAAPSPAPATAATAASPAAAPPASAQAPLSADFERPVMIHRAILGSLERFIAILTEHFAGKWPFWVSPRQIIIVPVTQSCYAYAQQVKDLLWSKGFYVDVDISGETLPKKIRNAEIAQYNFTFVVGVAERDAESVNVRNRDDAGQKTRNDETIGLARVVEMLSKLRDEKSLDNKLQ